jgi:predicted ribonuclease YlaK
MHNLPIQPTVFVGRTEELSAIIELLSTPACRLLTLVGPGGIGKTRLALEAARQLFSTTNRKSELYT